MSNLNLVGIPADNTCPILPQDNSAVCGKIEVYFRELKNHLLAKIAEHGVVVGCVAWLTDREICLAIAARKASIVVQKEDFLRPDGTPQHHSKALLQALYSQIGCHENCHLDRFQFSDTILNHMSTCADPTVSGVRCVGNRNRDKAKTSPRMHNKFLVFCEIDEFNRIGAKAVWTGSFNFTHNAGQSFENAVFINDPRIAYAYLREYAQIMALSEPLDWTSEWMEPEWRIGT